jgi:hypothetical protein
MWYTCAYFYYIFSKLYSISHNGALLYICVPNSDEVWFYLFIPTNKNLGGQPGRMWWPGSWTSMPIPSVGKVAVLTITHPMCKMGRGTTVLISHAPPHPHSPPHTNRSTFCISNRSFLRANRHRELQWDVPASHGVQLHNYIQFQHEHCHLGMRSGK